MKKFLNLLCVVILCMSFTSCEKIYDFLFPECEFHWDPEVYGPMTELLKGEWILDKVGRSLDNSVSSGGEWLDYVIDDPELSSVIESIVFTSESMIVKFTHEVSIDGADDDMDMVVDRYEDVWEDVNCDSFSTNISWKHNGTYETFSVYESPSERMNITIYGVDEMANAMPKRFIIEPRFQYYYEFKLVE